MNVKNLKQTQTSWVICKRCQGLGKKSKGRSKKAKRIEEKFANQMSNTTKVEVTSDWATTHLYTCSTCLGAGVLPSLHPPLQDREKYPHIAIIGGGIGGMALAVACLHRGIPFTLYERDDNFEARAQGYGLTLQQASKAMKGLGIVSLKHQVVSTQHLVHNVEGKVMGTWGMRKWLPLAEKKTAKNTNIHIARQSLRFALLEQLGEHQSIQWGHQLLDFNQQEDQSIEMHFQANGERIKAKADLIVGADGIRSTVRRLWLGEELAPLRYLGCMVILGICPLSALEGLTTSTLLDSATVFQTANGHERIYIMPYTVDSVMWQLSFPIEENEAKALSASGVEALKEEACRRTPWHDPIPQLMQATLSSQISGYPVYDRELLDLSLLPKNSATTVLGDAAHPMSPFKGQGANQALLDALLLARTITKSCISSPQWRQEGIRASILTSFEAEMLERSASKVKDSAAAAQFLHSDIVLQERDQPRGSIVKSQREG